MVSKFPLVNQTRELVRKENELSGQIIKNLQKISDEKVHLQMGYPSLFTFCVKELKMSEAVAYRRCDAVKMSRYVSDLPEKLEQGSISLNRVGEVSKFIRQEMKEHGSNFHTKEVRALINGASSQENDLEARRYLMGQSVKTEARLIPDKKQMVAVGRTKLEFEVDDEFLRLLEQVKNLHSHRGSEKLGSFLKEILKTHLRQNHPAYKRMPKKAVRVQGELSLSEAKGSQVRNSVDGSFERIKTQSGGTGRSKNLLSYESTKAPAGLRTRTIPASIRRVVWQRDQGRCTYQDPLTQRRCGSRFRIQIEHVRPFSLGGEHSENNLVLRCQAHNLLAAQQMGLLNRSRIGGSSCKP